MGPTEYTPNRPFDSFIKICYFCSTLRPRITRSFARRVSQKLGPALPQQPALLQLRLSPLNPRNQDNVRPPSPRPARRLILADFDPHQKRDQIVMCAHAHDLGVRAPRVWHEYDLKMRPRLFRPRVRRDAN